MEARDLHIDVQAYSEIHQEKINRIMMLSSKLLEAIPQNNDDFLWELLELCLSSITEADYGSISVIDESTWRIVAAKGHNWELLRQIPLRPEYSMKFGTIKKGISSKVYIIEDLLNNDTASMPAEIQQKLVEASMPIKQSLIAEICFNGRCKGHICLDIGLNSSKKFKDESNVIIKAIGDITAAYLMMKENYYMVDGLEQAVDNRTKAIRNLLDNVGQGLLTFGSDFIVHQDYSYECQNIFGMDIENLAFTSLIYPENKEDRVFIQQVLSEVFSSKEQYKAKVYISLLPKEIELNKKYISLEYKIIDDINNQGVKSLMVILTDITEKKLLENQVREDAQIMRMVANVAGNSRGFMECVKEFQYFYGSKLHEILDTKQDVAAIYASVFREIHTFKGSFSQFDMLNTVQQLGAMENALSFVQTVLHGYTHREMRLFIYSFDIADFLDQDLRILQDKLGNNFLNMGEKINIDKEKLAQIENEIINICSPVECRVILPLVKGLKYKSIKELLESYPSYAIKLAEKLEKPLKPFNIEGDDLLIDGEKYSSFIKSLVHVFRNSVDHGLESIDKRLELGKDETGNINCCIKVDNEVLEICIEDDGCGIDFEQIRNKAVVYGLYDYEQAARLDEKQLTDLLFRETFTTRNEITELSGHGMGLFAVKSAVENMGGSLELKTIKHLGTKLTFSFPINNQEKSEQLTAENFIQPVLTTTLDFLMESLGNNLNVKRIEPFTAADFQMLNYNSFINIKGLFDGLFGISADNQLSNALLNCMVYENIKEEQVHRYTKDVIAECANMILGNSIKAYPDIEELIIIGTPSIICSTSGDISYEGNEIQGYKIETDKGTAIISIIQ